MMGCGNKRREAAGSVTAGRGSAAVNLVLGLGATGQSVARWLSRRGQQARFADSRREPAGLNTLRSLLPHADVHTGPFDVSLLDGVERVVVSPGIRDEDPFLAAARERGLPVLSDIDLFVSEAKAPVAAVTGSNGKSTVVSLLSALCAGAGVKALAGANLGTPVLDLLTEPRPDYYLLELSSFQLQRTSRLPARVATVLNVSADHLDWHGSLDAYARAKYRIYRDAEVAVVNRAEAPPAGVTLPARRISFGADAPGAGQYGLREAAGEWWLARGDEDLLPVGALHLFGRHNWLNVLAALAMGEAMGLEMDAMVETAIEFSGLAHRSEFVAERDGVAWINDSKGTNVGAAVAAVQGIPGPVVLIAGGDGKGASFEPLAAALKGRLRAAVLIGRDARLLADALTPLAPTEIVADMDRAVVRAAELARPGDTVILAPACASLDMFSDYRARGEAFRRAVEGLGQ
jgi:UDP-N-acetylmuramoylalanine--D-glutamate ligase